MNRNQTIERKIPKKAKRDAFTLVEIMLVMLITSVLVLGVNAALRQAHLLWSRIEEDRPIYQKSRLVIETLRQELGCLYFPKGTEEQQLIPFHLSTLPDGITEISFHTLVPSWMTSPASSYTAKVCYRFSTDSETDQGLLTRTERYFSGEKPIAAENKDVILKGLAEFNAWVIDSNSNFSLDSWKNNLECDTSPPRAVKIQLNWPQSGDSPKHLFQIIIVIPCQAQSSPG